jgi:L-lactate transport
MPWPQVYAPVAGSAGWSAAAAAVPLAVVFTALAGFRLRAHQAALLALAAALAVAVAVWGMPARLAGLAALHGAAYGLFPVFFIVLSTLFLYNLTVAGGQFEVIRSSLAQVTSDRRIQALLIAFCFGAFIEGAAGFGAPVAIAGATLVGLGFRPFYAASLCLIANTAPVAFGSIGTPIIALAGVMGLNDAGLHKLSAAVGHQLPLISCLVPLYITLIMVGFRRTMEVWPAVATCGITFAACQWYTASALGPYLPDLVSSLAAMGALVLLLKFWRPRTTFRFDHEAAVAPEEHRYRPGQVLRGWAPYAALTLVVLLWGTARVKAVLSQGTFLLPVPGLDQAITRVAPGGTAAVVAIPAVYKVDLLASTGGGVLLAALLSAAICGLGPRRTAGVFGQTVRALRNPALTIATFLALAYVMNASGMTASLGLWCTRAGRLFPFFAPVLGWLGVFLTGSDTASNVLFGGLQRTAAEQLGLNPILTGAANASGGVMGKMISPQSMAVACAAAGMVGEEAALFRFTLRHSLALLLIVCLLTFAQAYYLPGMIPR